MSHGLPKNYGFNNTRIVRKVRDIVSKTMVDADEDEVAGAAPYRTSYDVSVSDMLDDPMVAVMLLSYLRKMLGGPDIHRLTVEVTYQFESLSKHQLDTLFALIETSWSALQLEVEEETRYYERSNGLPPLRRDEAA